MLVAPFVRVMWNYHVKLMSLPIMMEMIAANSTIGITTFKRE